MKYLLLATATWTESHQHPSGKCDQHESKTKRVEREFTAVDAVDAGMQQEKLLELMKQELKLPPENGSLRRHSRFEWRDIALWVEVSTTEKKQAA